MVEQEQRRASYLQWRERAAAERVRQTGLLKQLTHSREEFYAAIDDEHLWTCSRCHEAVYPTLNATRTDEPTKSSCPPTTSTSNTSRAGSPTGGCAAGATSLGTADSQRRAVTYIRESTEEQGQGFLPDAQREGIRRFAPENNLELIGEYCDFHSGWRRSDARPEFQRLMADAAAGAFVHRLCSRCSSATPPARSLIARSPPG